MLKEKTVRIWPGFVSRRYDVLAISCEKCNGVLVS